jgi:hypothetical protein
MGNFINEEKIMGWTNFAAFSSSEIAILKSKPISKFNAIEIFDPKVQETNKFAEIFLRCFTIFKIYSSFSTNNLW